MCEIPEFFQSSEPIARKDHKCVECGNFIKKGTKYVRSSGKWDGDFDSFSTHVECHELSMWLLRHAGQDCVSFGEALELTRDVICWDRTTPKYKEGRRLLAVVKWKYGRPRNAPGRARDA